LRTQSIGALNFEHIRTYVDDIITVKENEIEQAMRALKLQRRDPCRTERRNRSRGFMFHTDELPKTKMNVAVVSGEMSIRNCWLSPQCAKGKY